MEAGMERVQRIYTHPLYQRELNELKNAERERVYCKHDEAHFLAVARIMYINCLESSIEFPKELIYAAAFLHDVGRAAQYRGGVPHEEASVRLAAQIMPECGFRDEETSLVCALIAAHRNRKAWTDISKTNTSTNSAAASAESTDTETLAALFYEADKQSRSCFCCEAASTCNWAPERRVLRILK